MVSNDPADLSLPLENETVARCFEEISTLLSEQDANPFRVRAYQQAAQTIRGLDRPLVEILEVDGLPGLIRLPHIGESLARAINELVHTGHLRILDRLRGEHEPERLFTTIPGIGRDMASRIHDLLGIETLSELEAAAYDGSLERVPGMGKKRIRAVRDAMASRLQRPRPAVPEVRSPQHGTQPSVAEILDVDAEYRARVERDSLPRVAPRRFNPTGAAWLPILHTHRDDRHYTALFSNTARAHGLGTVRDWVVIYRDDHGGGGQWTVITARFGRLKGQRVVRGREDECERL
ncbi:DNA polymerase/3'-5' exonuclease PolX [Maioricimonas rarisocia]|uniref:DNA polymerase/3'-5' exonuclease PolX n=1 Tax=Maioricimonas rarisocia TaxID=2528026 RepID=A0A517Z8E1_9PLAN|nr:helix-hairpin-helix domain-containing protein [Maioricimonas rarisocia]QDU38719.1 DNA polymerase/3'-5' exonuclease PolX [Maioricimonas rarisocia]